MLKSIFLKNINSKSTLNKFNFLFFATGRLACTFVSSITNDGGAKEISGLDRPTDFETFHEIIYGKPTRCKRAPGFFLPLRLAPCLAVVSTNGVKRHILRKNKIISVFFQQFFSTNEGLIFQ